MKEIHAYKKFLSISLVVLILLLQVPKPTYAGLLVTDVGTNIFTKLQTFLQGIGNASNAVTANLTALETSLKGADKVTAEVVKTFDNAIAACDKILGKAEIAADIASMVQGFNSIAGSGAETGALIMKTGLVKGQKECFDNVDLMFRLVKRLPMARDITETVVIGIQNTIDQKVEGAKKRYDALHADARFSAKDMLKAIMLGIGYKLADHYTQKYVNKLVSRYKVNNFLNYTSLLGGQVYAMDYIRNNFKDDGRQAAITRYMLLNSLVPNNKALTNAQYLIKSSVGYKVGIDPASIDPSDPNLLNYISRMHVNEFSEKIRAYGFADDAKAAGMSAAAQEVAVGNGYMSSRNCYDSQRQQAVQDNLVTTTTNKISATLEARYDLIDMRTALKKQPQSAARDQEISRLNDEIKKATEAEKAAEAEYNALPKSVDSWVKNMCAAITNPATTVSKLIQGIIDKHLSNKLQPNDKNMPLWASNIANSISSLTTKFIAGGMNGGGNVLTDPSNGFSLSDAITDSPAPLSTVNKVEAVQPISDNEINFISINLTSKDQLVAGKDKATFAIDYPPSMGDLGEIEVVYGGDKREKQPVVADQQYPTTTYGFTVGPFTSPASGDQQIRLDVNLYKKDTDLSPIYSKTFTLTLVEDEITADVLGTSDNRSVQLRGREVVFE